MIEEVTLPPLNYPPYEHRVTTSKSGAGSYIAGVKKKNWLLRLEERTLAADEL